MTNTIFDFIGNNSGEWKVTSMTTLNGDSLAPITHLQKVASTLEQSETGIWTLKGITSNLRYTEKKR